MGLGSPRQVLWWSPLVLIVLLFNLTRRDSTPISFVDDSLPVAGSRSRGRSLVETPGITKQLLAASIDPSWKPRQPLNVTTGALVHGWVVKAGPLDLKVWHSNYRQERSQKYVEWLQATRFGPNAQQQQERLQRAAAGLPDEAPPLPQPAPLIFPECHVFVNHQYKFIYIRHPKTASSTLLSFFTECHPADKPNSRPGPACLERLDASLSPEQAAGLFASYLVFTVVRSPYIRALSSYKFLVNKMLAGPGRGNTAGADASSSDLEKCQDGVSWDAYCADPVALGGVCNSRPECCVLSSGFFWHHTIEQARCMLTSGEEASDGVGRWAVDYVARMEHLEDDMQLVLQEIDRRRPLGMPPLSGRSLGRENTSPRLCQGGSGGQGSAAAAPTERHTELWVAGKLMVYNASVPREQYCEAWAYFSDQHSSCLRTLEHFYSRDFQLLYRGELVSQAAAAAAVAEAAPAALV